MAATAAPWEQRWLLPFAVAAHVATLRGGGVRRAMLLGYGFGATYALTLTYWMRAVGVDAWLLVGLAVAGFYAVLGVGVVLVRDLLGELVERHGEVGTMVRTMAHSPAVLGGTSSDPRVAAMIDVALKVYREPTGITDAQVDALRGHGFSDREIADVVGVVALNVLTGAFNLLAGLIPATDG